MKRNREMSNMMRRKHMIMDTICNGTDISVRVVGHTNDTKRGWTFNTNHDTKGEDFNG